MLGCQSFARRSYRIDLLSARSPRLPPPQPLDKPGRLLKTQHTVSAAPSAPGTLSNALSAYPAFAHSGPHISSVAPANGDAVAGAAPSSALPPPPGLPGVVTGSANVRRMSAGEGIGFPAGGAAALRRVRSAGGDRLQQLAMAEAEYAKNGLYSHKTGERGGGNTVFQVTVGVFNGANVFSSR